MGRSLGTDVRDAAARPDGSGAARGSRVQFVLRRTRSAPLGMRDRVRLQQEPGHIGVWPDQETGS